MNPLILGPLIQLGERIISRFVPDTAEKEKAEAELLKMLAQGELSQITAQLEINAHEASHASVFVAGWRPAAGWAGVIGLFYTTILQPIFNWIALIRGWPPLPPLDSDLLWVVLTGMLGIGGLRTYEKAKGVSK